MQTKEAILKKLGEIQLKEGTVPHFIGTAIKEGIFDKPVESAKLSGWINERFCKKIPSNAVVPYMKSFLRKGIVKSKIVGDRKKTRIWFGAWLTDKDMAAPADAQVAVVIEPGKPFTAKKTLAGLLSNMEGEVRICDPYLAPRTLDILHRIPTKCKIKILTQTISYPERLKREFSDFKHEHPGAQVKVYSANTLHDRFILSEKTSWQVGHSFKDLGTKQTNIIKITPDIEQALLEVFNRRWKEATPLN